MSSVSRISKENRIIKQDPVTDEDLVIEDDPLEQEDLVPDEDPIADEDLEIEEDLVSDNYPMAADHTEALPFEERVRQRAHGLYLSRGSRPGSALEDWLQAEEEIRLEDRRQSAAL